MLISQGKWNEGLLRGIFYEEDCKRIIDIPVSICGGKDRLTWMYSNLGQYTIKTGYVVAKGMQKRERREKQQNGSSSKNDANLGVWKFLWSLNVA